MSKIKDAITNIQSWFSKVIMRTFSSRKQTFKFIALIVFTFLFLMQISTILINNSFYNNASDDILQYYTIMVDFINGLKDGTVSWFNLNNYFGASFFSDIYYIPIDVFTGTTFLLSYLMPTEIAYSITELIKIFIGVMLLAYYLSLKGMKNRTIFWMSIIYFISGGSVSFMAFPVFLTLTVSDGIDIAKLNVWSNTIDTYPDDYFAIGAGLSIDVKWSGKYKSLSIPKYGKIATLQPANESGHVVDLSELECDPIVA